MSIPAQNQQYENFIIRYKQNIEGVPEYQPDERFQIINDLFGVLYVPIQEIPELALNSYSYSSIPRCYTYMDTGALSASGVTRLHGHPYLKLKGSGTLVAIIDSGIDYHLTTYHARLMCAIQGCAVNRDTEFCGLRDGVLLGMNGIAKFEFGSARNV